MKFEGGLALLYDEDWCLRMGIVNDDRVHSFLRVQGREGESVTLEEFGVGWVPSHSLLP